MLSNKELLNKKRIQKMVSLPTIELTAEEADQFIDYMVDESVLKNNARIVRMAKESKNIRALGLGSGRILKPAATFSSSDYKKELAHNLITLTAKKVRGCVVIYDDDLEDNPEGESFVDHVMKMVAGKIANELDEAYWIADTHDLSGFGSDDIRSVWDGWRYRIDHSQDGETYENDVSGSATILDASNAITDHTSDFDIAGKIAMVAKTAPYNWEFKFSQMLEKLPSKYKKGGLANLRFFTSDLVLQNYIDALSARSTILGDNAILGKGPLQFGTVPIVPCPLMPTTMEANGSDTTKEDYATDGTYTDCMLTHKENLIVGIHRNIKIESQREAADEATYWFYSLRADLAIENVEAIVILKRLVTTGSMVEA